MINTISSPTCPETDVMNRIYAVRMGDVVRCRPFDDVRRPDDSYELMMDGIRVASADCGTGTVSWESENPHRARVIADVTPHRRVDVLRTPSGRLRVTDFAVQDRMYAHIETLEGHGDFRILRIGEDGMSLRLGEAIGGMNIAATVSQSVVKYVYTVETEETVQEAPKVLPETGVYRDGYAYYFIDRGNQTLHAYWDDANAFGAPYHGPDAFDYLRANFGGVEAFLDKCERLEAKEA